MKKFKPVLLIISIGVLVAIICYALLIIPKLQIPTLFQSSGLVAIVSAILGVIMTVAVTAFLLKAQSETESRKDKDIRIYQQKINIYAKFTEKMWGMLADNKITKEKLKELRNFCFQKLVFYLNNDKQITEISEQIRIIEIEEDGDGIADNTRQAIALITHILQKDLDKDINVGQGHLQKLYNAFKIDKEPDIETQTGDVIIKNVENFSENNISFWHFNILGDEQIEAFNNKNWRLSLIEYNESWRTNILKQIKKDDVILLYQRGGPGYIGAFRAKETEVYTDENQGKIRPEQDIYDGLNDGATSVANIHVEPIAYNYEGIGTHTIRRRTICPMNDALEINKLLQRFKYPDVVKGVDEKWIEERRLSENCLSKGNKILNIDSNYFEKILNDRNLTQKIPEI